MLSKIKTLSILLSLILFSLSAFSDVLAADKIDAHGRTALTYAVLDGNINDVKKLLDKGADVHVRDELEGKTILMTACEKYYSDDDIKGLKNQQDLIALLLDRGHVDIDEKDKHGNTALMRVAYRGIHNVLRFLIKRGADVNAINNYGSTPLLQGIVGCHYGSGCTYKSVMTLLDNGAHVNVKDDAGHTPFYYSKHCKCEKSEVQKLLKDKGALDNLDTVQEPLVITSPKNGETFKEGDIVSFTAELSPDFKGSIADVSLATSGGMTNCYELKTHPRYTCKFKILAASPREINLIATGATLSGGISSEVVVINVVIPKDIVLQELKSFEGNRLVFFRIKQKRQIYVDGVYSDGVERNIRDADSGTIYSSSNENIVIVNSAGLATAIGPGEAKIIVKNGKLKLVMNVIVRHEKD